MRALVFLCLAGCLNVVAEGGMDSGGAGGGAAGGAMMGAGGGSGGSGGSGGVPDAGSCGCTQNGRCVPGDSPLACGSTGGVCNRCAQAEQCVSGQCTVAMCGPGTCTGCCGMGFCVTASMQSRFACGLDGVMCTQCMQGQQCRNGACVTPVCDPTTCPMGCCQNGQCLAGDSRRACGSGGAACADCGNTGVCSGGACMPFDAGPPAPIGSPCPGGGGGGGCGTGELCLPDTAGFPGGYCSAQCTNGACPMGATCVTQTFFGFPQSGCFATCGSCRSGYACQPGADGGSSYCRPSCTGGGPGTCPTGTTCSVDAGTCG